MRKRSLHIIVLLLALCWVSQLSAQNLRADSLRKVLNSRQHDTARVNTLNELSYEMYLNIHLDSCYYFAQKALEVADRIRYKRGRGYSLLYLGCYYVDSMYVEKGDSLYRETLAIARDVKDRRLIGLCYHLYGGINWKRGNLDSAFKYYDTAMVYYKSVGDKHLIALVYRIFGMLHNQRENYVEANRCTYEALRYFEEVGDELKIADCYQFSGRVFQTQGNYTQSLSDYKMAAELYIKLSSGPGATYDKKFQLISTYTLLGDVYLLVKHSDSAMSSYNRILEIGSLDSSILDDAKMFGYAGIGTVYEFRGDSMMRSNNQSGANQAYKLAENNYRMALELYEEYEYASEIPLHLNFLGGIQLKLGKLKEAYQNLHLALSSATSQNLKSVAKDVLFNLSLYFEKRGRPDSALVYFKKYVLFRDSLTNEANIRASEGARFQYDYDKREAIAKAEQDRKDADAKKARRIQLLVIAALGVVALAVVVIALIQWRSKRNKQKANLLLQQQKETIESTLIELKDTQAQLIQSEKMASLGQLTAGIAHEIQNPLNFVNNFSDLSAELFDEMNQELNKGNVEEAKLIASDLKQNLERINHHGQRAGDIVKSMLEHSRSGGGHKELTDINQLADEYLKLAYHGYRAKDQSFNAKLETDFDPDAGKVNIIPQEIGRVLLNLVNNAFYAVSEKKKLVAVSYEPLVIVQTKKLDARIEIKIIDNGNGIPDSIKEKIFQPFFTTKPTGQGTGLGLSLSYDIVKAHGGTLKVTSKPGEGTEFSLELPSG